MEAALEAGAEDFKTDEDGYEIITDPTQFEPVHKQMEAKGYKFAVAEVTSIPTITVPVKDAEAVTKLLEALEEHDDVKEVYSNADIPEAA